jgi:hypothetical protein
MATAAGSGGRSLSITPSAAAAAIRSICAWLAPAQSAGFGAVTQPKRTLRTR